MYFVLKKPCSINVMFHICSFLLAQKPYPPKISHFKTYLKQYVHVPFVPPRLIQIKASDEEINQRITKFMEQKREEVNRSNIRDFCRRNPDELVENSCARIDCRLMKRRDAKGHLQGKKAYFIFESL